MQIKKKKKKKKRIMYFTTQKHMISVVAEVDYDSHRTESCRETETRKKINKYENAS